MSEIAKTTVNKQQYAAPDAGNLVTGVKKVSVTICPRSLSITGYGDNSTVLAIRYSDYKNVATDWIIDFFEHQFINEPLLNDAYKVTSVFIGSEKGMVIPSALYNPGAAEEWLKKVHFVENDDIVTVHQPADKLHYIYAWPLMVQDLIKRYFPKAKIYPLTTYQFGKQKSGVNVACCITAHEAIITIHNGKQLCWHEVSKYNVAEDIAYRIHDICNKLNLSDINLNCAVLSPEQIIILHNLEQYFERVQAGETQAYMNANGWETVVYLSKRLYQCAS